MADLDNGGNWIKLNRSIWDSFIWSFEKPQYSLAWVDILLMANYRDKKILFDGKVMTVKQGSFITSIVKLSERWNMNRRTVKHFLDLLQSDGMITYTSTHRCTTIFVTKYLEYQGFAGSGDAGNCTTDCTTPCTTNCTTDCTQHKKIKESKEGKEVSIIGSDEPEPTPQKEKIQKHKYGEYKNVLLTDGELEKLKSEYPDWQDRVERLSSYMASTGRKYKSHYATIRNWARKDGEKNGKAASDSWSAQRIGNHV